MPRRKLGDIEQLKLIEYMPHLPSELTDTLVHVKHLGLEKQREWAFAVEAIRNDELRRIIKMREGLTPALAPKYWPELVPVEERQVFFTEEGMRAMASLAKTIVREAVQKLTAFDGRDVLIATDIETELGAIGACELLIGGIMGVQSPTMAQRFSDARVNQTEG